MTDPMLSDAGANQRKGWRHRVCPPQETLANLKPHFASMGITRLADITGLDRIGIPVVQAVRPLGRSLSVSQGKGIDLDAAWTSAAMEAVEGWHAEFIDLPVRRGTMRSVMSGYPFEALPQVGTLNAEKEISFFPGRCITTGAKCWIPSDLVHKDYTRPPEMKGFFRSTNGLASGNTLAEAVASAVHELVERDALAVFGSLEKNERRRRRLDNGRIKSLHGEISELIGQIEDADMSLFLHDVTSEIGVPTVLAQLGEISADLGGKGRPLQRLHVGSGCHLDPVIAIVRAITEAAQSRLTQISGSRDDLSDRCYQPEPHGNALAVLELAADRSAFGERPFDYPDQSTDSAGGDVDVLLGKLNSAGIQKVAWVDLSREVMPIKVVRVVIAGLGILTNTGTRLGQRDMESGTQ